MSEYTASNWATGVDVHRTLAERALAALHQGIVSGELAAGQRLRIEELAAALNMSHLPIREAIRQLESRGLVEHIPHRGAHVTELSVTDAVQIYDARLVIEPEIIRRAAERFSDADVVVARAALVKHTDVSDESRRVETWQTHTDFHFALYEPCAATWLLRVLKPLWETSQRYRLMIPAVNAEQRRQQSAIEHEQMLDACIARDGESAAKILYDHLATSANLITTQMDGTEFRPWSER